MDRHFSSTEKRTTQVNELEQEIIELEARLATEQSASVLNDIRLRLRFLKWKKELLSIAYGK